MGFAIFAGFVIALLVIDAAITFTSIGKTYKRTLASAIFTTVFNLSVAGMIVLIVTKVVE